MYIAIAMYRREGRRQQGDRRFAALFLLSCIIFIRQFKRWLKRSSALQLGFVYTAATVKTLLPQVTKRKKRGKLNNNQLNSELREKAINCNFAFSFSRECALSSPATQTTLSTQTISTQISELIVSGVVDVAVIRVFHFTIC